VIKAAEFAEEKGKRPLTDETNHGIVVDTSEAKRESERH
jgi:hypothetical protein